MANNHGRLIALAALLALCPFAARAQAVLVGRVVGSGQPIANAEVLVDSLRARTDAAGRFVLTLPVAAKTQVAVRAVGFQPAVSMIEIAANDTTRAEFTLTPVVQTLDSVTVKAQAPATSPRMIGFEERRKSGFGYFITRDDLAKQEHSILSNVIRRSSVKLMPRPINCGGGYAVATGRGGSTAGDAPICSGITRLPPGCYAPVFVDGVTVWAPGWGPPINIDQFKVIDLEGVEVYRSTVEAPLQFQQHRSPCGVILFWTRTGHK
jgi:hypothetical protein